MKSTDNQALKIVKTDHSVPLQEASLDVALSKYSVPGETSVSQIFDRVAGALAELEKEPSKWKPIFLDAMHKGAIPAGRILANAGAAKFRDSVSTINCTVSSAIPDSMKGILQANLEAGLTLKTGAGIGYEFSTLRPEGSFVSGAGAKTSGPLSFMDIFDKTCFTVSSAGGRRGAQMATFDVRHPDIEKFIKVKRENGRLRQFNLSVLINDEFMEKVISNGEVDLVFPQHEKESGETVKGNWPGKGETDLKVYGKVSARKIWDTMMKSTYDFAEPGIILIDRINDYNNNWFCEEIRATNPCVTGDTRIILKNKGQVMIKDVVDEEVEVWNGFDWSKVTPQVTGEDQDIYQVTFTWGKQLFCTGYHKFILEDGSRVECKDLKRYSRLMRHSHPSMGGLQPQLIVTDIAPAGKAAKVYCFNEPKNHSAVFNDILTANCGEQPLPPYGACLLGSVNLTKFVKNPFSEDAYFDMTEFRNVVKVFNRMLDNVVDINGLPLPEQQREIEFKRRHGIGIIGLGSALVMLGKTYGDSDAVSFTEVVMRELCEVSYSTGLELAKEKGAAPIMSEMFQVTESMLKKCPKLSDNYQVGDQVEGKVLWSNSKFLRNTLPTHLLEGLENHGCRYTHAVSIAPTGTISLSVCNNASNGIEPSFAHHYKRNIIKEGRKTKEQTDVYSYELLSYRQLIKPDAKPEDLPPCAVDTESITPAQHIAMQAAAQKYTDSSISKTINVPTDFPFEDFKDIYLKAYKAGLKGCTTFRFNPEAFSGVLVKQEDLENTTYQFTLEDGSQIEVKGSDDVVYEGETHKAANLFDALKEGYYGKL